MSIKRSLVLSLCLSCALPFPRSHGAAASEVAGTPFEKRVIVDGLQRDVTYYISRPKKPAAPILLMLQGSGCVKVLNEEGEKRYSTLFNLVPYAREGDFTVVAVEKPYAGETDNRHAGTALACSAQFNADFTAERWLVAIRAALDDARNAPWVDRRRTLVFGMSEGAAMAALLAARDPGVTDVIAIGGPGTGQLFSFVAGAYQHCFNTAECLADAERNLEHIQADPESSTRFAWGHPFKRWTSFFRLDPADELLKSNARVYIAFGTADRSTPALSAEVAIAKLRVARRDVTVRRVPDAGHSLSNDAHPDYAQIDREYRAALDWFWRKGASAQVD